MGNGNNVYFSTPMDVAADPNTRAFNPMLPNYNPNQPFATNHNAPAAIRAAAPLLTDVISFSVRAFRSPSSNSYFEDLNWTGSMLPYSFDTVGTPSYAPTRILGLQISIRIWDSRTEQARQVTIIQDL
jgi:hypothetical protein